MYYPKGWQAYVDGEPTPHFRVNYALRGMVLPPGTHTVVFQFEPEVIRQHLAVVGGDDEQRLAEHALLLETLDQAAELLAICRRRHIASSGSAMLVLMAAFGLMQSAHVHRPR